MSKLTYDGYLVYEGYHGSLGLCHLRIFESDEQAIAIVGQSAKWLYTSVTNAVENVAEAIMQRHLKDRTFTLIQFDPDRGITSPEYILVRQERDQEASGSSAPKVRHISDDATAIDSRTGTTRYKNPKWESITEDVVEKLVGQKMSVYEPDEYVPERMFPNDIVKRIEDYNENAHGDFSALISEFE